MEIDVNTLIDLLDSKLIFSTPDGNFEGILKLLMLKMKRITFEHAYILPSRKYMGTLHVKFSDLMSFERLQCSDLNASKLNSVGDELMSGDLEKQSRVDESVVIDDMNLHVYERLPHNLKISCPDDYCFVESIDSAFIRAVRHISEFDTIGISFHGPELSRHGYLSWICITTPQCLFMFDIDSLGIEAFHKGLRKLLEEESIEKIIHDCREPADCLKHLFQTDIKNVFDTQIADYLINMQRYTDKISFKYVSSLDSCLVKYLNLPQQFLHNRNKCLSKDAEIKYFEKRPISDEFKSVLIKSALYLLALKEKQEKVLLYPFHQAVNIYLNVLRDSSEAEVFKTSDEFSQLPPRYLLDCIKVVQYSDLPVPSDDTVKKFKQTSHGEVGHQRMLLNKNKDLSK